MIGMLTLMVKLQPTPDQVAALLETMERFNAACNAVAEVAFQIPRNFEGVLKTTVRERLSQGLQ